MVVDICVSIKCDGLYCDINCPYFEVSPGASFERLFVEHCSLFKKDLKPLPDEDRILRCPECNKEQRDWASKMKKFVLKEKCQCKEAALKLMELTRWKVDIWEYETIKDLLNDLIDRYHIQAETLKALLEIDQDTLDQLLRGATFPYLTRAVKAHFNFPQSPVLTRTDLLNVKANAFKSADIKL